MARPAEYRQDGGFNIRGKYPMLRPRGQSTAPNGTWATALRSRYFTRRGSSRRCPQTLGTVGQSRRRQPLASWFSPATRQADPKKSVRPTAKPMNPGTPAAVVSHWRTFSSSSPRPKMIQLTVSRPPRRATATIFSQSSRRSSPSIFQMSGSTPSSWSCRMASTISRGRISRS